MMEVRRWDIEAAERDAGAGAEDLRWSVNCLRV